MVSIRRLMSAGLVAVVAILAGCVGDVASPNAPTGTAAIGVLAAQGGKPGSPFGTNALALSEVTGSMPAGGSGIVNVIPTGQPGANNFQITVNVHGAPPDTDLYFQIRGDTGLPGQQDDGICQRAATWPAPPTSLLNQVLHTSAGGAGALHVSLPTTTPGFDSGVTSDFMYRIVDFTQAFELRTACASFTGK
jgi:hypothetical protein